MAEASLDEMIGAGGVDGVILATPNQLHIEGALACVAADCQFSWKSPSPTQSRCRALVTEAEARGIPFATGRHRRHNGWSARRVS